MTVLYFVVILLIVTLLIMLRSIKITTSNLSTFELSRRIKQHEVHAVLTKEHDDKVPDLLALRYVAEIILGMILIGVLIQVLGIWRGIFAGLVLQLVIPKLSSWSLLGKPGQNLFDKHESDWLEFANRRHNILKYFRQPSVSPQTAPVYSKEELLHVAEKSKGLLSADELKLLKYGLEFSNKKVCEIMVPVRDIESVNQDDVLGPVVLDRLHKAGHSCFPVIKKDMNHVVGILSMADIVSLPRQLTTVKRFMRPEVFYVREDLSLEEALHGLLHTRGHLFIVINELRETVGLLSLEDVIRALLGRRVSSNFNSYDDIREAARHGSNKDDNQINKHEDL